MEAMTPRSLMNSAMPMATAATMAPTTVVIMAVRIVMANPVAAAPV